MKIIPFYVIIFMVKGGVYLINFKFVFIITMGLFLQSDVNIFANNITQIENYENNNSIKNSIPYKVYPGQNYVLYDDMLFEMNDAPLFKYNTVIIPIESFIKTIDEGYSIKCIDEKKSIYRIYYPDNGFSDICLNDSIIKCGSEIISIKNKPEIINGTLYIPYSDEYFHKILGISKENVIMSDNMLEIELYF